MPLAASRLEILQVRKLIQCVREKDIAQIAKMAELGITDLLNYQGWLDGGDWRLGRIITMKLTGP